MKGIFEGMGLTFRHLSRKKVTRLYPYEKPNLPERSRGLIKLILEPETHLHKCESCLLCEKVCPPRAITIDYKPLHHFRRRPYFSPTSKAGYYRPRISIYATDYAHKPLAPAVLTPLAGKEIEVDTNIVEQILATAQPGRTGLTDVIDRIQQHYGYLPLAAARRLMVITGVDLSDIFGIATASNHFKPAPLKPDVHPERDQPHLGHAASLRNVYGNIHLDRGPSA